MEDQNQLFENVLQDSTMSHLPKSQFGPVAFADLARMSLLYVVKVHKIGCAFQCV